MPDATLNGTSFAGSVFAAYSTPRAPQEITPAPVWPGDEWRALDGTPIVVLTNTVPRESWELRWTRVPEATRAAVRAVFDAGGAFSATFLGATRSVQCPLDGYSEAQDIAIPGPIYFFNVTLKVDASS